MYQKTRFAEWDLITVARSDAEKLLLDFWLERSEYHSGKQPQRHFFRVISKSVHLPECLRQKAGRLEWGVIRRLRPIHLQIQRCSGLFLGSVEWRLKYPGQWGDHIGRL